MKTQNFAPMRNPVISRKV